jgi:hypothetical protein
MKNTKDPARIGILCWEAGQVPRGLVQLESLKGNSTNPDSYDFPVRFCRVRGANIQTILENPDRGVLREMIVEARSMISDGVRAITTSCGFNAIFQKELASSLEVPVFTSSLLQVPLVHAMLGPKAEIGVITAKKAALKKEHLEAVGIHEEVPLRVFGLEKCPEWGKICSDPDLDIDLEAVEEEVTGAAEDAVREYPGIRAFVLECTDLPPFAPSIRRSTKLPVFDFITLVELVAGSL